MEGWQDKPPAPGNLINQEPNFWSLEWIEPGQPLYGDPNSFAQGVPECVHKLADQLPPHEQPGQPGALILAGDTTYKIFHANAPFGATLAQTVSGLQPGSQATLVVPILVVLHGETDAFGAESGVWINGSGGWVNGHAMGNRNWFRHRLSVTIPDSGQAEVVIRVKSKWPLPKDFFIDGISLEASPAVEEDDTPHEEDEAPGDGPQETLIVHMRVPPGLRLVSTTGAPEDTIEVKLPRGVEIKLE